MRHLTLVASALLLSSLVAFGPVGCKKDPTTSPPKGQAKPHKHDHAHEGPNGGVLAEWGDEKYHAEFTVDHDKKQATVYILDGSAKKYVPIAAETIIVAISNLKPPIQVTLKADAQKDDPKGKSSRFTGVHEKLATVQDFKGEISGTVDGVPYNGDFEEKEHDHKHDKKK